MSSGWELSLGRDESPFVVGMIWSGWQDCIDQHHPLAGSTREDADQLW